MSATKAESVEIPRRSPHHTRAHQAAQADRRGVRPHREALGPRAHVHRARRLQRDVERALLLQVVARAPPPPPHEGPAGHPGARRERRRRRHRRRLRGRLQDGVAQPPELHRAVPGRGDGRGRHPARRLHDGRAPHREPQLAPLRAPRSPAHAGAAPRRRRRHRRLRQLRSACPRSAARCSSTRRTTATSSSTRSRAASPAPIASSTGGPRASATRSSTSAPRPAATASTARPWPPTSSARRRPGELATASSIKKAFAPRCRSAIPSWASCSSRRASSSFSTDLLEGIQDMGAAGLTSSSVEMAGRAENGIELDLDSVPRRAKNMTPYEILLSESQERMLLVAKPGSENAVLEICKKWELDAAVIGRVTDTKRWVVKATPGYDPLDGTPPKGESGRGDSPSACSPTTRPSTTGRARPRPAPRRRGRCPIRPTPRPISSRCSRRPTSARARGFGGSTITSCAAAPSCGRAPTPPSCACPARATARR